jgi:tetratricopeptide (TPR) repeat protein
MGKELNIMNRFAPTAAFVVVVTAVLSSMLSAQARFDLIVRNDMFAGLAGNMEALGRAMAACERILEGDPNHAEALVWHGSGTVFLSARAFQEGDAPRGMTLFQKGVDEMARAVELEPTNIGVRIPRGATLREATRNLPAAMAAPLLEAARTDLQTAFDLQKQTIERTSKPHPLGELLQALGDIYSRQGKPEEAAGFYRLMLAHLPGTGYAVRADEWMQTRQPLPAARSRCIGCHAAR